MLSRSVLSSCGGIIAGNPPPPKQNRQRKGNTFLPVPGTQTALLQPLHIRVSTRQRRTQRATCAGVWTAHSLLTWSHHHAATQDSLLTASLRNVAPCHVAFKIKTTATDRYRVRPNIGVGAHTPLRVMHRVNDPQTPTSPLLSFDGLQGNREACIAREDMQRGGRL